LTLVVGVDGAGAGWVAVWLKPGQLASAEYYGTTHELLIRTASAAVVAIDVPIGLTNGKRDADLLAAALLGPRRSSIFPMPPRALATLEYAEARAHWQSASEKGFSIQTWAILPKVLEAEQAIYQVDPFGARIIEVHPELSFAAMAHGHPMKHSKRSWNGHQERLSLLDSVGLSVARDQGDLGKAAPDDVLDAFAAAWTADRFSRDAALSVPEQPTQFDRDRPIQIWR
jgi:predicted RNase H-like nuclease